MLTIHITLDENHFSEIPVGGLFQWGDVIYIKNTELTGLEVKTSNGVFQSMGWEEIEFYESDDVIPMEASQITSPEERC